MNALIKIDCPRNIAAEEHCRRHGFEPMISGYLDNELSPSERIELEAHLDVCPVCGRELQILGKVINMLNAACRI